MIRCYGCGKILKITTAIELCRYCWELKFAVMMRKAKLESSFPFLYQQFPVGLPLAAHLGSKQSKSKQGRIHP